MTVERICQRDVDTAEADASAFLAAERMHQRSVGALVIVDDARVPIGIVTDRDLVIRVIAAGRDPCTTAVREVMTPWPKTVQASTPIESALPLMQSGSFRRLPIVDEQGQLVGILTLDDILLLLSEELSQVGRLLERETPRAAAVSVARPR
jgi:CBS domain-containing protein